MNKKVDQNHTVIVSTAAHVKPRQKIEVTFKKEAVALWLGSGKSAEQTRQELFGLEPSGCICGASGTPQNSGTKRSKWKINRPPRGVKMRYRFNFGVL